MSSRDGPSSDEALEDLVLLNMPTKPCIKNFAKRRGMERFKDDVFDKTREIMHDYMSDVMRDATEFTRARSKSTKAPTVSVEDVSAALQRRGKFVCTEET